jgi:hypothetical protein
MMTAPRALPAIRGNFVLLKTDQLRLLLPQQDVGAATYLSQMPRPLDEHPGMFELLNDEAQMSGFVAALSPQMTLQQQFPEGQFLLTSLTVQEGMAFCWQEVKVLIDTEIRPQALPALMLLPGAALTSYVELDGELAFCCTGEALVTHVFGARS